MKQFKLKSVVGALGLAFALASGQAAAAIQVSSPVWSFEDDDIDAVGTFALINGVSTWVPDANGTIDEGDVLFAIFEIDRAGGADIGPTTEELTGIAIVQVDSITPTGFGFANIIFEPLATGLNVLGLSGFANGSMLAMWHQTGGANLNIALDEFTAGTNSCNDLATCFAQATDGALFQVDGFADPDDPDNYWIALNAATDTDDVVTTSGSQILGAFNAGLSILVNNTGVNLIPNARPCGILCDADNNGVGGDGFVDVLVSGTIGGGLELSDGLKEAGFVSLTDAQLSKTVPEPASLALLGIGLLGLGAMRRRRS